MKIHRIRKAKLSCEIVELLSKFSGKNLTEDKLMQELVKVKKERDIALAQLKGRCFCCKYRYKEFVKHLNRVTQVKFVCGRSKFAILHRDCELWEWNGGIVNGTDSN